MEFLVHPQGFAVNRRQQPGPDGHPIDVTALVMVDQTGVQVSVAFAGPMWQEFQRFVADPEGEMERQQARAKLLSPNGMSPSIKKRP